MSGHSTCGGCRWSTAIHEDGTRRDDIVECEIQACIVRSGEPGCSAWEDYQALEAEIESLRYKHYMLLEACKSALQVILRGIEREG